MNKIFSFFQGRHTFFAISFAVTGSVLAFMGKLTAEYVALVTALQAYILIHSTKESYFDAPGVNQK